MRALLLAALLCSAANAAAEPAWVRIPGNARFASVLDYEDAPDGVDVPAFELSATPVTNTEFRAFVQSHPEWGKDRVPSVMADERYLQALDASADPQQPVVWVSWFAAQAYCEAQGARLPTWNEWELAGVRASLPEALPAAHGVPVAACKCAS